MNIQRVVTGQIEENCYVLSLPGSKEALLIDPGDDAELIKEALKDRQPAAILLTHGHWDHTGALTAFPGTPIYMHSGDAPMLKLRRFEAAGMAKDISPRPEPTDFVQDGQVLKLAGISLQVLHTPGHTPGGVCYLSGDVIFTGDTLFDGDYGRTDLPGGSMAQMRQSLRMLLGLHGVRAYPGHGGDFVIA